MLLSMDGDEKADIRELVMNMVRFPIIVAIVYVSSVLSLSTIVAIAGFAVMAAL